MRETESPGATQGESLPPRLFMYLTWCLEERLGCGKRLPTVTVSFPTLSYGTRVSSSGEKGRKSQWVTGEDPWQLEESNRKAF